MDEGLTKLDDWVRLGVAPSTIGESHRTELGREDSSRGCGHIFAV
jgi:hypothetical protein